MKIHFQRASKAFTDSHVFCAIKKHSNQYCSESGKKVAIFTFRLAINNMFARMLSQSTWMTIFQEISIHVCITNTRTHTHTLTRTNKQIYAHRPTKSQSQSENRMEKNRRYLLNIWHNLLQCMNVNIMRSANPWISVCAVADNYVLRLFHLLELRNAKAICI